MPALPTILGVGAGTAATASPTAEFPPPTGVTYEAGDLLLLYVETAGAATISSVATPDARAWAQVASSPQASTTVTQINVWWRRVEADEVADPGGAIVTHSAANHVVGGVIAVRGAKTTGNPWDTAAGGTEATSDTSAAPPTLTTTVDNCLVLYAATTSLDSATTPGTATSAATLTGEALTDLNDATTLGNGGGVVVAKANAIETGAIGTLAITLSGATAKALHTLALAPAVETEWPAAPELQVSVTSSIDGVTQVFSQSAADLADVPMHIEWQTQNPGGFGDASFTLARPLQPWAEETGVYSEVTIGVGADVKYRGRIKSISQIDTEEVRVDCEGPAAKLDDNEAYRFLGVHQDLTQWTGAPRLRQQVLLFTGYLPSNSGSVQEATDNAGANVLALRITAPWAQATRDEMWLWVEGQEIGEIQAYWSNGQDVDHGVDFRFETRIGLSDDEDAWDVSSEELTASQGNASLTPESTYKYATLMFGHNDASGAYPDGFPYEVHFAPVVFGAHGLPRGIVEHGAKTEDPVYQSDGLLGSDVLPYVLNEAVPDVPIGIIDASDFVIPHLVHGPAPVRELVEAITAFGDTTGNLPDWGIYEDFFWATPKTIGEAWTVRKDEVAKPLDEGKSSEEICDGVFITYQDTAGRTHTVGPPGSGAETEDAALEDTTSPSPSNRIKFRNVGLTTPAGALRIGAALLAEHNTQVRKGSVTITGFAESATGEVFPAMDIRACDTVEIEDQDAGEDIPVVTTAYSHDDLTCVASLGSAPHRIDILLARLAAVSALNA
jgi:hypothetical protein